MGLDSIWVLPWTRHLMCPKFSILYYEFVQTESGGNRGLGLGGGGGSRRAGISSAHHLRRTKITDEVFLLNGYWLFFYHFLMKHFRAKTQ